MRETEWVEPAIELRQLRYFVAVAEELHFGRAAARLHMSQSPLSRAIRELERDLGVVLFLRTTRHVELTPAGQVLLERGRRALTEVELAIEEARRAAQPDPGVLTIGHGPLSRQVALDIAEAVATDAEVHLEEDLTPELLRRVASHEIAAAAVFRTPSAASRHGIRVDALRDEPLLAALPEANEWAEAEAIPVGAFAKECVLLPRGPGGRAFNDWLRAVVRAAGFELERTLETTSAPWDHRMLPVAAGEAVSVIVQEWADAPIAGVVALPFDPPLSFPIDLASSGVPTESQTTLVRAALALRDAAGWLARRD